MVAGQTTVSIKDKKVSVMKVVVVALQFVSMIGRKPVVFHVILILYANII